MNRFLYRLAVMFILAGLIGLLPVSQVQAQDLAPVIGDGLMPQSAGSSLDAVGCSRLNTAPVNAAYEQRVVELVNIERGKVGLPPLKRNTELDFAARDHTRDMVEDNYFAHDSYDRVNGVLTVVCTTFTRVKRYYSGYSAAGENLAARYSTPEAVVAGWMASPGHKANILSTAYREIGVGFYQGAAQYTYYWGQDFGAKSNIYPVIINNEASQTTNPVVTTFVYGKGVWAEMRVEVDQASWSGWMPFQESYTWQLPATNGTHTLSVELRASGAAVAGAASSDTIEVTGMPLIAQPYSVFIPLIRR
jgi:uncharacterized protein YkwD